MRDIEIHPAAECFRLMHKDELDSLIEDIKANGLRDRITLGRINGHETLQLVDGRNRLIACQELGILPQFETRDFDDDDEVRAFVKSRSARRDLTKGERAAGLALLYPGGQGKRDDQGTTSAETAEVSYRRLAQARQVLRHSRELAEAVRDGHETLDDALARIKQERERLQSAEEQLARLRSEAADLAARVQEDGMKLSEAYAAFEQRKKDEEIAERNKRETLLRLTESAFRGTTAWAVDGFAADVSKRLSDPMFKQALLLTLRPSVAELKAVRDGAVRLAAVIGEIIGGARE